MYSSQRQGLGAPNLLAINEPKRSPARSPTRPRPPPGMEQVLKEAEIAEIESPVAVEPVTRHPPSGAKAATHQSTISSLPEIESPFAEEPITRHPSMQELMMQSKARVGQRAGGRGQGVRDSPNHSDFN